MTISMHRAAIALLVMIALGAGWFAIRGRESAPTGDVGDIRFVEGSGPPVGAGTAVPLASPTSTPNPVSLQTPAAIRSASTVVGDDVADQMLPPESQNPRALYARLRSEQRDAEWAPRAEQTIKAAYIGVPYVGTVADPLRIRCGASVCEVTGAMARGLSMENTNVAMEALQGKVLADKVAAGGLQVTSGVFGSKEGKQTFVGYLTRK